MDNVINKIIEIDEKARQKLKDAYEQKCSILLQAKDEEDKIKQEMIQRANNRLCKVEEFEKANSDEAIAEINAKRDEKINNLNKIFEENHVEWENDIFNGIVRV